MHVGLPHLMIMREVPHHRSAHCIVAHTHDKEGLYVVGTLQPIDSLEIHVELLSFSPNHGLVVTLKLKQLATA
jgi:hypothetical protein